MMILIITITTIINVIEVFTFITIITIITIITLTIHRLFLRTCSSPRGSLGLPEIPSSLINLLSNAPYSTALLSIQLVNSYVHVSMDIVYAAKPPFTKPPFVNSRGLARCPLLACANI